MENKEMVTLKAEEVRAKIFKGEEFAFMNKIIEGDLCLKGVTVKKSPLDFRGSVFNGYVDLRDGTIDGGVVFTRATINNGDLSLRRTTIHGGLDLERVTIKKGFLDLREMKIRNDIRIIHADIDGYIGLSSIRFIGKEAQIIVTRDIAPLIHYVAPTTSLTIIWDRPRE